MTELIGGNEAMVVAVAPGRKPVPLDLRPILRAEERLHEVQLASKIRSGELLHTFNQACLDTKKAVNQLSTERNYAERYVARMRAVAIFDKLPDILKSKGLKGSEDVRSAFLATDPDHEAALDVLCGIEGAIEFFEIRYKAFERAYYATHKLTDMRALNGPGSHADDYK